TLERVVGLSVIPDQTDTLLARHAHENGALRGPSITCHRGEQNAIDATVSTLPAFPSQVELPIHDPGIEARVPVLFHVPAVRDRLILRDAGHMDRSRRAGRVAHSGDRNRDHGTIGWPEPGGLRPGARDSRL